MYNEILLYSGGADSLIAYFWLKKRPTLLYVNLGHQYALKEIRAMNKLQCDFEIDYILEDDNWGRLFEDPVTAHIPARNLLLTMYAAGFGANKIYLVAQKGEQGIPDRSPEFFKQTSEVLSFHFERDIEVINPFPDMYKSDMVKWFIDEVSADVALKMLRASLSCYQPGRGHCGQCGACFRKWVSLKVNGFDMSKWFEGDVAQYGLDTYLPRLNTYDARRQHEIMFALNSKAFENAYKTKIIMTFMKG